MFHRRLRMFLWVLSLAVAGLLARSLQLQVMARGQYGDEPRELTRRVRYIDPPRGDIRDRNGVVLATDEACIDVCVDYRAITSDPDEKWMRQVAVERLRQRVGREYDELPRGKRRRMIEAELPAIRSDIDGMWVLLAEVSEKSRAEIDEIRQAIVQKVEMRRRQAWDRQHQRTVRKQQVQSDSWWRQWLVGNTEEIGDGEGLHGFDLIVSEQTEAHPILRNVDAATNNTLGKQLGKLPGLTLRGGATRRYPMGDVACHVIGRLGKVTRDDLDQDPNPNEELRKYFPNDLIGRSGVEAMAEQPLRGMRGKMEYQAGSQSATAPASVPERGRDVVLSIDATFQREVAELFRNARTVYAGGVERRHVMHGAAVVIDVPTAEVLALVSYPTFDLNRFNEMYPRLVIDDINTPLLNRATQAQLEPGSSIKPVVGMAAVAAGVTRLDEGLACQGYLVINGTRYAEGRCWVASKFGTLLGGHVANHPVPWEDPLPPPYLLHMPDALQRSCNTYFEVMADRMKLEGLSRWFEVFGLGQRTGLGIEESAGRLPKDYTGPNKRMTTWFAGIGQGQITATPIQMANVAATIARDGVWMAPILIAGQRGPRRELPIPKDAVAAVREGMVKVVNTRAGTGNELRRDDIVIAGKTGTAQAARKSVPIRDENGKIMRDERGQVRRRFLEPSTRDHPNPEAPWYLGTGREERELNHAWFIGYAPAHRPRIAFAVMVEYGGSGGITAAGIAKDVIELGVQHGYLK